MIKGIEMSSIPVRRLWATNNNNKKGMIHSRNVFISYIITLLTFKIGNLVGHQGPNIFPSYYPALLRISHSWLQKGCNHSSNHIQTQEYPVKEKHLFLCVSLLTAKKPIPRSIQLLPSASQWSELGHKTCPKLNSDEGTKMILGKGWTPEENWDFNQQSKGRCLFTPTSDDTKQCIVCHKNVLIWIQQKKQLLLPWVVWYYDKRLTN